MHHHEIFSFLVKELIGTSFNTGCIDLIPEVNVFSRSTAGFYISQLCSDKSRTFARFYMLKLYDCI